METYRRFSELRKFHIKARDGEIGKPENFYFDDQHWIVRYFIVKTGGWLFDRGVLITPGMFSRVDDREKTLGVDLTRDQVKNSPPVETAKPLSRYYEEEYYHYYGWEPYWVNDPFSAHEVQPVLNQIQNPEKMTQKVKDNHLGSSKEMTGYRLLAVEGEIGTVKDFILGDKAWKIRYLEVDVGNWLTGRKVVVSPTWITDVDWLRNEIVVKLSRELIKNAPEYDPSRLISKEYELEVYKHYSLGSRNFQEDEK